MSHDTEAMVAAHKVGQQLYRSVPACKRETIYALAAAGYKTVDERTAFIGGYFGAAKRATMNPPTDGENK